MELLSHILAQGEVQITFPQQNEPFTQIVEGQLRFRKMCGREQSIAADDTACYLLLPSEIIDNGTGGMLSHTACSLK